MLECGGREEGGKEREMRHTVLIIIFCSLACHNIKGSGVPLFRYGTADMAL